MDRVAFRVWKEPYIGPIPDVLAILPDNDANPGMVVCYAHVGQHGEGDMGVILAKSRPATRKEYRALLAELRGLGYKLRVVQRISRKRS